MITFPKPQLKFIARKLYNTVYWLLLLALIVCGWPGQAMAASGDGLFSYGSTTTGEVGYKYRTWAPSSYGAETSGPENGVYGRWIVIKASPTNPGVYVMAQVNSSSGLKVYSWNGSWTSEWTATTVGIDYRPVDLAFENSSGNVLVIYLTTTSTTTLYYQEGTWNGTDYNWGSGSTTFSGTTIGNLRFLRLANKLNADEMIAAATGDDGTNQVNAKVWDGSAFGNEMGANGTVNSTLDNMDAVYETSTGDGMVAWGVSTGIDSAVWSGGSWTSQAIISTTNAVKNMALAADNAPTSDDIALGAIEDQTTDDVWGFIWGGSSWTRSTELDTNTAYTVGRGIDVAYAGTTGNAILVFADSAGATLDWARSTGGGAFAVQTDYDPTPTFGIEHIIALVPDASGSNVIMDNFVDNSYDLWGFYYDDDTTSWSDPTGAALDTESNSQNYESFMFAWESVYRVPTLTEMLFLALVGGVVFLGIRTGVIKLRKSDIPPRETDRIDPKDIQDPPTDKIDSSNSHQNQGLIFPENSRVRHFKPEKRSIDGISQKENNKLT